MVTKEVILADDIVDRTCGRTRSASGRSLSRSCDSYSSNNPAMVILHPGSMNATNYRMRTTLLFVLIALAAVGLQAQRQKHMKVYSEYFSHYPLDSMPPHMQIKAAEKHRHIMEKSPRGFEHLGRFGNGDEVRITLTNLPKHQSAKLSIGFHIVGSWDGEKDDDRFTILVDGKKRFSETFSNTIYRQSFPALEEGTHLSGTDGRSQ